MKVLLWQARQSRNITLVELAKRTGVSKSTLNNIENYRSSPTQIQLERIAVALNCRITDLFDSEYK